MEGEGSQCHRGLAWEDRAKGGGVPVGLSVRCKQCKESHTLTRRHTKNEENAEREQWYSSQLALLYFTI